MAAGRTLKSLVGRRRRIGDEGEEDDGPVIVADSQSEGSILSDADDDNVSSVAEAGAAQSNGAGTAESKSSAGSTANGAKAGKKARKPRKKGRKSKEQAEALANGEQPTTSFKAMADTEAMMNGLKIDEAAQAQEAVDFETMNRETAVAPAVVAPTAPNERGIPPQRREHEEYRKKRDADPAFVPNRGNFFMHDTRAQNHGPPTADHARWVSRSWTWEGWRRRRTERRRAFLASESDGAS